MTTDLTIDETGIRELAVEFEPAPVAKDFIEDPAMVTGFFGPLGCSKTTSGTMKSWLFGQAWAGARIAVIRDTWPNLRDTTQHTFFDWFPPGVAGEYISTKKTFNLWTGQLKPIEILFRAMDEKEDMSNVLSLDIASFWIDEPQGGLSVRNQVEFTHETGIDHDLFLAIMGRIGRQRGYPGMCWLTGNPPDPHHWIAHEFRYDGKGEPKNPREDFHLYLGDQDTNRMNLQHHYRGVKEEDQCRFCARRFEDVIHQRDYYQTLEDLYGAGTPLALRFIHGKWVSFALLNPFREEWFQYWEERPRLETMFMSLGVDPAISKRDTANRSALVLAGQPMSGLYRTIAFILRCLAGRWSPYELAEKILAVLKDFPTLRKIRIEDAAWQSALKDIVEREAQSKGIRLPQIDLVPVQQDKLLRANRWSGLVETGRILFGPGQADLIDCCCSVPRDKSKWDPVDAMDLSLGGLPNLRAEMSPLEREELGRRRAASYAAKTSGREINLYGGREYVRNLLHRTKADPKARAQSYVSTPRFLP